MTPEENYLLRLKKHRGKTMLPTYCAYSMRIAQSHVDTTMVLLAGKVPYPFEKRVWVLWVSEVRHGCSLDLVWVSASLYGCFDTHSWIQFSNYGCHPPEVFADSEKTAALRAAGLWGILWGKPWATFGKNWPGQVRSRNYDVIRGTTSGNFTNKSMFYRTLTWRYWCKR